MRAVATRTAVEVVRFQPEIVRLPSLFAALIDGAQEAGLDVDEASHYRGNSEWLLMWGPGHPDRRAVMQRHVAAGGHVIALDLAYWSRLRKFRVSIDAAHPQAWVMRKHWPATRLAGDLPYIGNLWESDGPIIIAGLGRKARVQYGADVIDRWEQDMAAQCHARWPSRQIVMRPKPTGVSLPIEQVLLGASLLITWHSNVAIDAIRCGIPVVCRDGAAAAVCPSTIGADHRPLSKEWRDGFLQNLAHFQWAPDESSQFWGFLRELLA